MMSRLRSFLAPSPAWTEWSPGRGAAGRIQVLSLTESPPAGTVALVGLPDDLGVRLNRGRRGADQGPTAIRTALSSYGSEALPEPVYPPVVDVGDIRPTNRLDETHARVTEVVSGLLAAGCLPVGLGGGHDFTYPQVRALSRHLKAEGSGRRAPLTGIYLDAHLDVRERPGSGMSFRRILEELDPVELHVRGLDPMVNSAEHLSWFRARGGRTEGFGAEDPWPTGPLFLSLDLDVLDQAFAPGVSAPNPMGWSPAQVESWVNRAGSEPAIRLFDMVELSPRWDPDGRTARLAARLLLSFLRGVASRSGPSPVEGTEPGAPDHDS